MIPIKKGTVLLPPPEKLASTCPAWSLNWKPSSKLPCPSTVSPNAKTVEASGRPIAQSCSAVGVAPRPLATKMAWLPGLLTANVKSSGIPVLPASKVRTVASTSLLLGGLPTSLASATLVALKLKSTEDTRAACYAALSVKVSGAADADPIDIVPVSARNNKPVRNDFIHGPQSIVSTTGLSRI